MNRFTYLVEKELNHELDYHVNIKASLPLSWPQNCIHHIKTRICNKCESICWQNHEMYHHLYWGHQVIYNSHFGPLVFLVDRVISAQALSHSTYLQRPFQHAKTKAWKSGKSWHYHNFQLNWMTIYTIIAGKPRYNDIQETLKLSKTAKKIQNKKGVLLPCGSCMPWSPGCKQGSSSAH